METTLPGPVVSNRLSVTHAARKAIGVFDRQRGALMPWSAVSFGAGVGWYFTLTWEPVSHQLWMLGFVALMLLCASMLKPIQPVRILVISLVLIISGFCAGALRTAHVAAPVLEYRTYGAVWGRVVHIDRSASDKPRLMLDQVHMAGVAPEKTPRRVRISLHGDLSVITPRPGDHVMMTAHVSPPPGPAEPGGFDFQRHAWFKGLGGVGYSRLPVLRYAAPDTSAWLLRLARLRTRLAEAIRQRVGGAEGPFAAAILTGDRSAIPRDALEDLRASNLAHLLAISGLHMGLLTGVVFGAIRYGLALIPALALRWPIKKIAAICALICGFAYLGISGANVATQRAFIMVSVMLLAICLDKRALTLRAVALAALIVLLVRPESIYGPGFQMSFAATTALVAGFRAWRDLGLAIWMPKFLSPVVGVAMSSLIAGLATAPFAAAHFNMFAQYGLLANLLSVPVMGLAVMPGAVLAGLLSPIGLEAPGVWVMTQGLAWILAVAHWVAELDGSVTWLASPGTRALPVVAISGLFLCLWQGWFRLAALLPLAGAFVLWNSSPRPDLLLSDTGGLLGVMTVEGRALNKEKGDGFAASLWLENDGDIALQVDAAERADFNRNRVIAELGANLVLYDRRRDWTDVDLAQACVDFDFVLAVRAETVLGCPGITAPELKRLGSIALSTKEGGLEVVTANGLRGARPWVPGAKNQ